MKKKRKYWSSKKLVSQFSLAISIWSFPKAVRNLRIAKPYFALQEDKGEGGAFVVDGGQLEWCEVNINMLGDMGCRNLLLLASEVHLEPSQTSKMEIFAESIFKYLSLTL